MVRVLKHVGLLVFLTSLSRAQTLSTGSLLRSSCNHVRAATHVQILHCWKHHSATHRNRYQHACSFDLSHMGDGANVVRLEAPEDVPGLANDANPSVVRSDEEAIGARGDAGDFIALEELLDFIGREVDLGDVEEVK